MIYDRLIAEAERYKTERYKTERYKTERYKTERYKTEYISGRLSLQTVIKLYNSSDMSESFEAYT